ncbi:hypothetical protein HK102_012125 [Quaeritorhiza haematococci]|nr:hypothetical protein HK102_012125 [Quaeritorhiza haematococci]
MTGMKPLTTAHTARSASNAPSVVVTPADAKTYANQLRTLISMGFKDTDRNLVALKRTEGSLDAAIDILVNETPNRTGSASGSRSGRPSGSARSPNSAAPPSYTSQPSPVTEAKREQLFEALAIALSQLQAMGFSNEEQNRIALKKANGNLDQAVSLLLEGKPLGGSSSGGQRQQQPQQQQQPLFGNSTSSATPQVARTVPTSAALSATAYVTGSQRPGNNAPNFPVATTNGASFTLEPPAPSNRASLQRRRGPSNVPTPEQQRSQQQPQNAWGAGANTSASPFDSMGSTQQTAKPPSAMDELLGAFTVAGPPQQQLQAQPNGRSNNGSKSASGIFGEDDGPSLLGTEDLAPKAPNKMKDNIMSLYDQRNRQAAAMGMGMGVNGGPGFYGNGMMNQNNFQQAGMGGAYGAAGAGGMGMMGAQPQQGYGMNMNMNQGGFMGGGGFGNNGGGMGMNMGMGMGQPATGMYGQNANMTNAGSAAFMSNVQMGMGGSNAVALNNNNSANNVKGDPFASLMTGQGLQQPQQPQQQGNPFGMQNNAVQQQQKQQKNMDNSSYMVFSAGNNNGTPNPFNNASSNMIPRQALSQPSSSATPFDFNASMGAGAAGMARPQMNAGNNIFGQQTQLPQQQQQQQQQMGGYNFF